MASSKRPNSHIEDNLLLCTHLKSQDSLYITSRRLLCNQHKVPPRSILRLPQQLWHRNRHYVPSHTRCGDQPQIKKKLDCWESLPPIMPHVLPLYNHLVHCPNLLIHHNHNSSFSCELWEATVWSCLWSHNISVWIVLFDPLLIMQLMFFDCTPHQDNLRQTLPRLPMYKAYLSTLNNPKCYCLSSNKTMFIVNSGATVCISPHCLDLITYKSSIAKIKDLLSSN